MWGVDFSQNDLPQTALLELTNYLLYTLPKDVEGNTSKVHKVPFFDNTDVFLNLQAGFCLLEASSVVNKIC
jgi:hypothetical protein